MKITDFIVEGRDNARTAKELCEITGLKLREFFAHIEAARRKGAPICAAKGKNPGYYLAADLEELEDYITTLTRQEKTTRETRIACAHSLDALKKQKTLTAPPRQLPTRPAGRSRRPARTRATAHARG